MRTIKFRGKRVDNGEWIFGMPTYDFKYIFNSDQINSPDDYAIIPETLCQFTGLIDKNGKEIYDGDVCSLHYFTQELGENLGVREGESEIQGTINIRPLGLFVDNEPIMLYFDNEREHSEDHFEVIGNIH